MVHMNVEFLKTISLSDTAYVDLIRINGELKTHLMYKKEEPNIFVLEREDDGDTFEAVVKAERKE